MAHQSPTTPSAVHLGQLKPSLRYIRHIIIEMSDFPLKQVLLRLLSSEVNTFDALIQALEDHHARPLGSVSEVKHRDSKKAKGTAWEVFCREWLLAVNKRTGKYQEVWLLGECPVEVLSALGLTNSRGQVTKVDNGIDLIAASTSARTGNIEYTAIQCKYRSGKSKVDWQSLGTFYGLCAKSGPWTRLTVMTNCKSVSSKTARGAKEANICYRSFCNTDRETWLKICGQYVEHRLTDVVSTVTPSTATPSTAIPSTATLRELRVEKYSTIETTASVEPEKPEEPAESRKTLTVQPRRVATLNSLFKKGGKITAVPVEEVKAVTSVTSVEGAKTIEELRAARLARFG